MRLCLYSGLLRTTEGSGLGLYSVKRHGYVFLNYLCTPIWISCRHLLVSATMTLKVEAKLLKKRKQICIKLKNTRFHLSVVWSRNVFESVNSFFQENDRLFGILFFLLYYSTMLMALATQHSTTYLFEILSREQPLKKVFMTIILLLISIIIPYAIFFPVVCGYVVIINLIVALPFLRWFKRVAYNRWYFRTYPNEKEHYEKTKHTRSVI